jgi:hypothetical protein
VALEAVFADLISQLRSLQDLLDGLSLTTGVDRSKAEEPLLVDNLNDMVIDFQGQLKKLMTEAARAEKAVAPSLDLIRARRHLAASQSMFHDLQEAMSQDLLSYDRLTELMELGRESGPQWLKWTNTARLGLDTLRPQLQAVIRAYFRCWQEIAERGSVNSVSVRATGQRIEVGPEALKGIEAREVT